MEQIRRALERARVAQVVGSEPGLAVGSISQPPEVKPGAGGLGRADLESKEIVLSHAHLASRRIVAHDRADPRSKSFDILRTQVLQSMDTNGWQLLAVTSPTQGCGKTLTAINLALSIARHPERSVSLVDLDLQKPQLASCLGMQCDQGMLSVLEGRTALSRAMHPTRVGSCRMMVLPCEHATSNSSEWMSSRSMSAVLQELKRSEQGRIVILDMPPMLLGDDVISILPQIDCTLFVAAVGTSTASDIKECNKYLKSTEVVRVVLNKVAEFGPVYY